MSPDPKLWRAWLLGRSWFSGRRMPWPSSAAWWSLSHPSSDPSGEKLGRRTSGLRVISCAEQFLARCRRSRAPNAEWEGVGA